MIACACLRSEYSLRTNFFFLASYISFLFCRAESGVRNLSGHVTWVLRSTSPHASSSLLGAYTPLSNMLIKQWADGQAARHVLDDEDEFQREPLVPQIQTKLDPSTCFDHVLVVPSTMDVIILTLPKVNVGNISVLYPQLEFVQPDEEFDDDEQLYSATNMDVSRRKYPSVEIPLYAVSETGERPALAIVVPHFVNAMAEKQVAKAIAALAPECKAWLALAPCQLNNGTSISKLDISPRFFTEVTSLQPPHFITGISAALASALAKEGKLDNVGVLVLNSEGHPGFEKIDADAIMDAATVIAKVVLTQKHWTEFVKKLSGVVRKINSGNTSGMYL